MFSEKAIMIASWDQGGCNKKLNHRIKNSFEMPQSYRFSMCTYSLGCKLATIITRDSLKKQEKVSEWVESWLLLQSN